MPTINRWTRNIEIRAWGGKHAAKEGLEGGWSGGGNPIETVLNREGGQSQTTTALPVPLSLADGGTLFGYVLAYLWVGWIPPQSTVWLPRAVLPDKSTYIHTYRETENKRQMVNQITGPITSAAFVAKDTSISI